MMRSLRALSLCVCAGASMSCGARESSSPPATPAETTRPPPPPAAPSPTSIITTACVLHSGSARGHVDSNGKAGGSCDFDAECIAMPGKAAKGDGFVGVKCDELSCSCEWSSATDARVLRSAFSIAAPCTDGDTAKKLFLERCMHGLTIYKDDAGVTP